MINRKICTAVLLIGALVVSRPVFSAENWPGSLDQYAAQLRKTIGTTDMEGFLAVVKNPNGAHLVDVREANEFKAGHVPGMVNAPRSRLEHQIWKALGYPNTVDTNGKVYVMCHTGGRATFAAKQLKDLGFNNVTIVIMNLDDWQKQGHPFVTDANK
jgi:rhodanese-related sulfurtransferase